MQIIESNNGIENVVYLNFTNQPECHLNEDQIRHLVMWLCKNKSSSIWEIVCEELEQIRELVRPIKSIEVEG